MTGIRVYRTRLGDTLSTISKQEYGCTEYAMVIFQHNRDVLNDPNHISPGIELVIPYVRHSHYAQV